MYRTVLGTYNNLNIIDFINISIFTENFYQINRVVLDVTSNNTHFLVKTGKHGTTRTTDSTTMEYYVVKYISKTFRLKENTTIDRQI